jgi:hypothetical protein
MTAAVMAVFKIAVEQGRNTGVPSESSGQALHFVQDDGGITDNAPILTMAFRVDGGTKTKYGDSSLRSE